MKNILNAITAILIILFFGWYFLGNCCETKCGKDKSTKCDYSKYKKSGETKCDYSKCKKTGTKKECPHANKEESIITEGKVVDVEETKEDKTIEEYNKRISDRPGNGTIWIYDGDTTFSKDRYMAYVNPTVQMKKIIVKRAEQTISEDGKVTYVIFEEEEDEKNE